MNLSRRAMFKIGAGALAVGVLGVGGASRCRGGARTITIAGGQEGGFYLRFAALLADEIDKADVGLLCEPRQTDGSVDNIRQVSTGAADVGLTQADTALAAVRGEAPFGGPVGIRAIGRIYLDYVQLVVRDDDPADGVADLAGATVSIGAPGSGTAMLGERMIAAGLGVRWRNMTLRDSVDALRESRIRALLWVGGVPTPALAGLHREVGIRLLPTTELLPALRTGYGNVYRQVSTPAGGYGKAEGVRTIGVANLLVCAATLPEAVAAAVTGVVVDRAAQLVPEEALGTQYMDSRTLIGTLGVPLHPGAATAYRAKHG